MEMRQFESDFDKAIKQLELFGEKTIRNS